MMMMCTLNGVVGIFADVPSRRGSGGDGICAHTMAVTVKRTRESTNNITIQPIGVFLPFSFAFQLVCKVV